MKKDLLLFGSALLWCFANFIPSPVFAQVRPGIRVTLMGQAMIQHDLRNFKKGRRSMAEMKKLLTGQAVFTNLETAITPSEGGRPTRDSIFFHTAPPGTLDALSELKINALACSNNHAGDFGKEGIMTLLQEVGKRKILCAGIGKNLDEASGPKYLDLNFPCEDFGQLGVVAFASKIPPDSIATKDREGVNHLKMVDEENNILDKDDARRILDSLHIAQEQSTLVLAYQHNHYWQEKDLSKEGPIGSWKKDFAHQCIDHGADIYCAHGEPRMQGIEIYKGCPIFHCLGNFMFQTKKEVGFYGPEVWESVIVQIDYLPGKDDASLAYSIKLIPIALNERGDEGEHLETRGLPFRAKGEKAISILKRIRKMSEEFGTKIEIDDSDPNAIAAWVLK